VTEAQIPAAIIDRLRSNLRAASIRISEADLDGMVAKGLLRNVTAFEDLDERIDHDRLPDYLERPADASPAPRQANAGGTEVALPRAAERFPSIAEIAVRLRSGAVSPVELTQETLDRIANRGAELNAFQLVLADEALASARVAECEIRTGAYRGPLHGVPVAVKDLFAMTGTVTTAGSRILADRRSDFDAAGVERLRTAGAIIVGKTRLPEFAYSPGSNNPHYGHTRNPWNPERDAGGSSSGSGVAVADGMAFGALGSDTGGSIRIPAAFCGIVGLKPTFGRLSLFGAVPLSWSLDHLGPMTRTAGDAAIMLRALDGPDPRDPRTRDGLPPIGEIDPDVTGLRIGVLRDDGSGNALGNADALSAWREGLSRLERAGAVLEEIDLPQMRDLRVINQVVLAIEAGSYHRRWLHERSADYGEFARQRLLTAFAYSADAFVRAQQARSNIRMAFNAIFNRVDLLSTPAVPYGAPELGTPAATVFTSPFNALGWPAVSVPSGFTEDRLPLATQLAGKQWDEVTVLRAAAAIERG
jgi:aspartyl-tRNA(Asn)/glutamyl-tRNA(Gln) amidotransferase subunit A